MKYIDFRGGFSMMDDSDPTEEMLDKFIDLVVDAVESLDGCVFMTASIKDDEEEDEDK